MSKRLAHSIEKISFSIKVRESAMPVLTLRDEEDDPLLQLNDYNVSKENLKQKPSNLVVMLNPTMVSITQLKQKFCVRRNEK